MGTKWFLLKTADPSYKDIIAKCEIMHKKYLPKNELSITLINDGALAIVKVFNPEAEWLESNKVDDKSIEDKKSASVLDKSYSKDTHHLAYELLKADQEKRGDEFVEGNKIEVVKDGK